MSYAAVKIPTGIIIHETNDEVNYIYNMYRKIQILVRQIFFFLSNPYITRNKQSNVFLMYGRIYDKKSPLCMFYSFYNHKFRRRRDVSEAIKIDHILDRRREREKRSVIDMLQFILFEKRIALFIIALFLGRAVILYHISPFALAFLATAWFTKQKHLWLIFLFVCGGAFTYSLGHAAFVLLSAILFFTFAKAFLHRAYKKRIFFIVFLSSVMTRVFLFSISNQITPLEWMHLCVEALLTIVLLLIFMQSIPLLVHKTYQPAINSEEMICLIILFASVLTGLIGWTMYGIALENV